MTQHADRPSPSARSTPPGSRASPDPRPSPGCRASTRWAPPTSPSSACPSTPASPTARAPASARNAIRERLRLLRPYNPAPDVAPFALAQVADAGDIAVNPFDIDEAVETSSGAPTTCSARRRLLMTLGGDHTIALPLLRSVAEKHGPVALLHFDAHLDTWDTYFGAGTRTARRSAGPSRRASLDTERCSARRHPRARSTASRTSTTTKLGLRASCTSPTSDRRASTRSPTELRQRIGDRPLYISIDIDVLDPAHAPGTGTPEAGGMTSRELLEILRGLASCNLVAADVVEVAPAYDHAEITGGRLPHRYELTTIMARVGQKSREADNSALVTHEPGRGPRAPEAAAGRRTEPGRGDPAPARRAPPSSACRASTRWATFDALRRSPTWLHRPARGEQRGFAADAYGRVTGEVGPAAALHRPGRADLAGRAPGGGRRLRAGARVVQPDPGGGARRRTPRLPARTARPAGVVPGRGEVRAHAPYRLADPVRVAAAWESALTAPARPGVGGDPAGRAARPETVICRPCQRTSTRPARSRRPAPS